MAILVKKKSLWASLPLTFLMLFLSFNLAAQNAETEAASEPDIPAAVTPKKSKKVSKKLPKKHKMPEGFIPLDPSLVTFKDGVPQLEGATEKIDMSSPASDFEGVVQYVSGEVDWVDPKKTPAPQFKSLVRRGDEFVLASGAYLKFITQKRCLAVAFGPGVVEAPKVDDVSIWQIKTTSLRWLCPLGHEEKIVIDGKPLTLFGGELLYHNKKLLMRSGEGQAQSGRLEATNIYKGKENYWVIVKNQPHPHDLWKINQELPQPKESGIQEEPIKPATYRLNVGLVLGGAGIEHDSAAIKDNAGEGLKGGRIQAYFHQKKHTYFLALTSFEQNQDQGLSSTGPKNYAQVEVNTLSFGERFEPTRNWSFFYRVGLGEAALQFSVENSGCGSNCYTNDKVTYNVLTAAGGVDRIFTFPKYKSLSWVGVILSAEIQYMINTSKAKARGGSPLDSEIKNSGLSSMGLFVSVGPLFYF
ncbi:MAG: hypothetical protein SGJ18_12600 [Pseudomonadota bacterium]|nr:hypothetical protein [Pseudomonadota bacterium]